MNKNGMNSKGMTQAGIRRALIALALVALAVFPLVSDDLYYQAMLILTFLLAIGATGWNIMGGYAGYISLGNSAFIGLGAYTTGILAAKDNLSPFLGCLAGGLVAAVAAAVLSLVTRRTRGMYFIIVTFAALQLLGIVATIWSGLTGGSQGLALPIPTWSLTYQNWPFYYPLLALLVLAVAVSAWVRRSKLGLGLFAIADDEGKAAGLGLATNAYKLIAFVLGGTFLGVAGGIYAYYVTFLNVSAVFDIVTSMLIVLSALLGGRGTLWGPVLGAFIIEPLANLTSTSLGGANAGAIRLLLFGGLLGLVVLFLPRGLLPTVSAWKTQRQGQDQEQPDPERLRLPLAGPATQEGDRAAAADPGPAHRPTYPAGQTPAPPWQAPAPCSRCAAWPGPSAACARSTTWTSTSPRPASPACSARTAQARPPCSTSSTAQCGRRPAGSPSRAAGSSARGRQARAHAGLARTYQLPRLFPSLTVLENVVLAERRLSLARLFLPRVTAAERAPGHGGARRPGARPVREHQPGRAQLRPAQAHRARPGALARPGARPARRARGGHQPRPVATARGHHPPAARRRSRRPARRARRRVPRQPVRPGLRHGQRQDHRQRHGRRGQRGPGRRRRLPRRPGGPRRRHPLRRREHPRRRNHGESAS